MDSWNKLTGSEDTFALCIGACDIEKNELTNKNLYFKRGLSENQGSHYGNRIRIYLFFLANLIRLNDKKYARN